MKESNDICLSCGICCNGTMFDYVILKNEEVKFLETILDVGTNREGNCMPLPCKALDGNCCSIYNRRPTVCRTYQCKLLKKLSAGLISRKPALSIIESTKDLIVEIRKQPQLKAYDSEKNALLAIIKQFETDAMLKESPEDFRKRNGSFLLKVYRLRKLLDKEFGLRRTVT